MPQACRYRPNYDIVKHRTVPHKMSPTPKPTLETKIPAYKADLKPDFIKRSDVP